MAESVAAASEPIKLDVYFDYACPFAWAGQVWLDDVNEKTGGKLDITWRIFPLEQVNAKDPDFKVWEQPNDGTSSTLRSFQGFYAAKQQGEEAFKKFHAALFLKRHVDGRNLAGQAVLESAAEEAGLDLDKFREDLKSDAVFKQIEEDFTHGQRDLGVFGTPTIVYDNNLGAYLQVNYRDMPADSVKFFDEFTDVVRERPNVYEIKRPRPAPKK
jgi:predicted DsbA family dithiol-disulfide isomerase